MAGTFNPGGLNAPPTSIINSMSSGGAVGQNVVTAAGAVENGIKVTLSGALTANTYKEILAVSDSGVLWIAYAFTIDATARTLGIKVIIDGVTVFDAITAALSAVDKGIIAVGGRFGAGSSLQEPVCFNSSLSLQIKSSLTETDKVALGYTYITT